MLCVLSAGICGGQLLGVRSVSGLAFYDWETNELIRRIEITPKAVSHGAIHAAVARSDALLRWRLLE